MNKYRLALLAHWMNLAGFVGGLGLAAITDSVFLGLATVLMEAAALWVVPDLPVWRQAVDAGKTVEGIDKERAFYFSQLFGVGTDKTRGLGVIASDIDYLSLRGVGGGKKLGQLSAFQDLIRTSRQLNDLARIRRRGGDLTPWRLANVEVAINGWLRLQFGAEALERAIARVPEDKLWAEVDKLKEQIRTSPPPVAAVMKERLRQALHKLRTLPKLSARLALFQAKAESIAYSIQQMGDAAAASQGADVALLAESLVDQYDLLEADLAELSAQNDVREDLGEIDWAKELAAEGATNGKPKKALPVVEEDLEALEAELRAENWRHVAVKNP